MNIAILGSGGREHALCYKLKQSPKIERIYCIPGNAGTGFVATNLNMDISNFEEIYKAITKLQIDYVIVGPEQPLVNGIVAGDTSFKNNEKTAQSQRVIDRLKKYKTWTECLDS